MVDHAEAMPNVGRRWVAPTLLGLAVLASTHAVDVALRAPVYVPSDIVDRSAAEAHLAWSILASGVAALLFSRLVSLSIGRPRRERIGAAVACVALVATALALLALSAARVSPGEESSARIETTQPPFARARSDFGCGDHESVGPSTTTSIMCVRSGGRWDTQWIEDTEIAQPDAPPAHLLRVCEISPEMDLPCRFALTRSFTPGFLRSPRRFPESQSVSPLAPLVVRHDVARGVWVVIEGKTATTADADDVRPTWLFDHGLAPVERAVLALDTVSPARALPGRWRAALLGSAAAGCVLLFFCLRGRPGRRSLSLPYLGLLTLVAALPLPLGIASAVNAATWPLLATKGPTEGSAVATQPNECDAPMRITGTQTDTSAQAFCIDPHPVTRADYEACVQRRACPQAVPSARDGAAECAPDADTTPSSPMSCIARDSAETFCATRGARLLRSSELAAAHDLEEPELLLGFCNLGSCWTPKTPDTKELTQGPEPGVTAPAPHTYFRCAK